MSSTTGTKIAVGVAIAGVATIVIAALSSRSAQAAPVPGATPPTGSAGDKPLVVDPKNGITLKDGYMGVATLTGKDSSTSGMYEGKSFEVHVPNSFQDEIQSWESSDLTVVDPAGFERGQGLSDVALRRGETMLTFHWTQKKVPRTTTFKLVAK